MAGFGSTWAVEHHGRYGSAAIDELRSAEWADKPDWIAWANASPDHPHEYGGSGGG